LVENLSHSLLADGRLLCVALARACLKLHYIIIDCIMLCNLQSKLLANYSQIILTNKNKLYYVAAMFLVCFVYHRSEQKLKRLQ